MSRLKFAFLALLPVYLCAQDAVWHATNSSNLGTDSNWSTGAVPTRIATFDSTFPSVNFFPAVSTASLNVSNFDFPTTANFNFNVAGPYSLNFSGENCGITGYTTSKVITATNALTMTTSQLTISGPGATIGGAKVFAVITPFGSMVNNSSSTTLAQVLFDGSGDSSLQSCSILIDSSTADIYANAYGNIQSYESDESIIPLNNIGQVVFDGSGGKGESAVGTGSNVTTLRGDVTVFADIATNISVQGSYRSNNIAQILFDGSGGLSEEHAGKGEAIVTIGNNAKVLAQLSGAYVSSYSTRNDNVANNVAQVLFDGSGGTSLGAGGVGSCTVLIHDSAIISATTPNYGGLDGSNGYLTNNGQIVFSGSGGLGYGGAGQGSCSVTITDDAALFASATYYLGAEAQIQNNVAQMLFDGTGGTSYTAAGTGWIDVVIDRNAKLTALNTEGNGYIYTQSNYVNNAAQMLFDGSPGLNYAGGASGSFNGIIGGNAELTAINSLIIDNEEYVNEIGQIVFDGSAGFGNAPSAGGYMDLTIQDSATIWTDNSGTISGRWGNDCAQILFGASGGLQYRNTGTGYARVALEDSARIIAINSGSLVIDASNDIAQIIFDGSGGVNGTAAAGQHGTGNFKLSVNDACSIEATNSGTLGNRATPELGAVGNNNVGQIVFDGSGGLNKANSGIGSFTLIIDSSSPIKATNTQEGTISTQALYSSSKIGQIVFDGSKGAISSTEGQGYLTISFTGTGGVQATNSGTIQTAGTAQAIGQILFDGTSGTNGSGYCVVDLGIDTTIIATNTATGSIQGDQIAFYDTVVQGSGTLQAINAGGSLVHGVAFYGASSTAGAAKVDLVGSSLWIDDTVGSSFALGGISGDWSSVATFNQNTTINTVAGNSNVFYGDISGTGNLVISGDGQQLFAGANDYEGTTTVTGDGTKLTLVQSNVPGSLVVDSGAYFSGSGSVDGAATISGTVKAGNSPGTLYFLSGLTLSPSSTTIAELGVREAPLLDVSGGNANIAGTLQIIEDGELQVGTSYPIVTVSGGSRLGKFENVTNTGPFLPVVIYSGNEVSLTFQNHAGNFAALLLSNDRILRNIETLKHLDTRREKSIKNYVASAQNSALPTNPWSFYVEPTGSFGHVKSRNNVYGSTFQTVGTRFGTDYLWSDDNAPSSSWCYGLGIIGEYNHFWGQMYQNTGTFSSNSAYGSVYATFVPKAVRELSLNVIGGGGYGWYNFSRYPNGSSSFQTEGSPGGAQADALFDIEYTFNVPSNFRLTPTLALQYTYAHLNKYEETGAGDFDLEVGHQTTNALSTILGLRMNYLFFADSPIKVRPEIMAEWQYQYLDSSIDTYLSSAPGTGSSYDAFTIPGFARNSLIAGADLQVEMYDNMLLQLNWDIWYNKDALNNFFLLEYKVEF